MLLNLIYLISIISTQMDIADSQTLEEIFHSNLAKTELPHFPKLESKIPFPLYSVCRA